MTQRLCSGCRHPLDAGNPRCRQCGRVTTTDSATYATVGSITSGRPAPAPTDLPAQLGHYRVLRELGRGGMGRVLEAVDEPLGRRVAVKILLLAGSDGQTARRRFVEEARITGCLEHPGIAPVYSLGRAPAGGEYFSMKLVAGRNLNDILDARHNGDRGTLREFPLPRLVSIFERIVETIAYAHSRQILHRDLKPANVMVGAHGEVWVLDWGLAKQMTGDATEPIAAAGVPVPQGANPGLTAAGSLVGTPQYMAPEQAKGHHLDRRTDVFGLGALLYKMLTGQAPNKGPDYLGTLMNAALGEIPPVRSTPAGRHAPAELAAIAAKCLAVRPEDRYPSAGELLADVRAYSAGEAVSARPEGIRGWLFRWARRHRKVVALAGLGALVLLVGWSLLATSFAALDRRALAAERSAQAAQAEATARAQRRMQAFAPYAEATDLLMRGQLPDEAVKRLEQALQIDPVFPEAQFALGEALRLSGQPARSAQAYLKANELSRQITGKPHLQALLAAGMAHDGAGEYYESEQTFLLAEREGAGHPLALVGKAFRLVHAQRPQEARPVAEEALHKAPHLWETHFAAGHVLEELVDRGFVPPEPTRSQAVARFRKALELSPRQAETYVWLARSLGRGNPANRAEAVRLIDQSVELEPRNGNRYVTRAVSRAGANDLAGADADLRKARELGAARQVLLHGEAHLAYQRKDYATAYRLTRELAGGEHPWAPHVGNWVALGFLLRKDNEVRTAFDKWCKDNPHYPEVYALRGQLKARDGDYLGAVEEDRRGLQAAPYSPKLRLLLAQHLIGAKKWQEALTAADAALESKPGDFSAMLYRARCLPELGRAAEARALLERLAQENPARSKEVDDLRRSLGDKLKG